MSADAKAANVARRRRASEEAYRKLWRWDRVAWGSHCVDCYPGNCVFRVYVRDGKVWREEQAGHLPQVEPDVPDMNPMGCQKGVAWGQQLRGEERVLYPLKRVGPRGSGRWRRVSWDRALTEIADAILDALQEVGPESIVSLSPCNITGLNLTARDTFLGLIGGLSTDVNAECNDFAPGFYLTYGFFNPVSSVDDWFHSDLIFIWYSNPTYTRIPHQHYITEARYRGAEVVTVAPDYSPSAIHADYYLPVRPGTDAALALAMCHVIVSERLYDERFVREQTDLPLLVRLDTRRFLRAEDLERDGSDEQFYWWDEASGLVAVPRESLALGDKWPALEGKYRVRLWSGEEVEVAPVFELLKERLANYAPEAAGAVCGVHPEVIRELARKVAVKRTNIICCLGGAGKIYHGDLIERSWLLLLGLTGNWGKKGSGVRAWMAGMLEGWLLRGAKRGPGPDGFKQVLELQRQARNTIRQEDPTLTEELAAIELTKRAVRMGFSGMVPSIFLWYYHCGFREVWSRGDWHDPSMKRPFEAYWDEAMARGWWSGVQRPAPDKPPRVLIEVCGNSLRRTRGGQLLLRHLWPKLRMIVTVDWRMSTTALFSDYVLPAAQYHEKLGFGIPSTHTMLLTFSDRVVDPPGEAKNEWEIFTLLAKKLQERARQRGFVEYTDSMGITRRLDNLYERMTAGGAWATEEDVAREIIEDTALAGALPPGTDIESLRAKGYERWTRPGVSVVALAQASDFRPDETFTPLRWHLEKLVPYPTLTRRAQFYIDHEWFLEAGEELPCHKEVPPIGGEYPLVLTSGHNRWSVHSLNIVNRMMLETHRGRPHALMNPRDAEERGLADGQDVRVYNDLGEVIVPLKISPAVRPGQVVIYNGWEPYQFPGWSGPNQLEAGMVKWLHLAGGYGHLQYWPTQWQPCPSDRAVRVDVSPA